MKKTLLMAGALLALTAGMASAQSGLNLSWNDCGVNGQLQRNFACTTNSGANTMVGSIVIGADMPQLNGHEGVFDMQTNQAALSPWWTFTTPATTTPCTRLGSTVSADFNFLANVNCVDPWANSGFGGVNWAGGFNGPNRGRIRTVYAINPSTAADATTEYYVVKVTFTNGKSAGAGACPGCLDGACFVFNSSKMTQPLGVGNYTVSGPVLRDYVQWQGGGNLGGQCPGATPTQTRTWGSVKSLYR
jgi:hypothetical protein